MSGVAILPTPGGGAEDARREEPALQCLSQSWSVSPHHPIADIDFIEKFLSYSLFMILEIHCKFETFSEN